MPPDTEVATPSREPSVRTSLSTEMIFELYAHAGDAHGCRPALSTNRHAQVLLVAIVCFGDGKLAHEHIYWDQALVLKQIGL